MLNPEDNFVWKKQSTKLCTKCGEEKSYEYFNKDKQRKDGFAVYCRVCLNAYNTIFRPRYKAKKDIAEKERRANLRFELLSHYGINGVPECHCCGERQIEFLSIDHIYGGGAKHKKEVNSIYWWLKRNKFPEGFRDLCHNCNQAFGAYGYCPHQIKR